MDNKKKKIILGALISAVILGGVATSAYFVMSKDNGEDVSQEVRFNNSGNKDAKLVESKDGSTSSSSSSTDNKKSDDKKDKKDEKDKDKDKEQSTGSTTSSNSRRDERRDSVPITESRLNNTQEAGSRPIAPISVVIWFLDQIVVVLEVTVLLLLPVQNPLELMPQFLRFKMKSLRD